MKIIYSLLLILFIAPVVLYGVAGDSEGSGSGDAGLNTKNPVLPKNSGDGKVNDTVDPVKKDKDVISNTNDLSKKLDPKESENKQKKEKKSDSKDEQKEMKGSDSESNKGSKEGKSSPVREKCDSSSNSCSDDDKTLVACLRVPGNEFPDLSLLIQNKGKGPLSVAISAPNSVQLEKKLVQLQEKDDTELKVSIKGVESGDTITLTAGHGNCILSFKDQLPNSKKKIGVISKPTYFNLLKQTSTIVFLFLAALVVLVSILIFLFLRGRFARKNPRYEKLETELPVSHDSKLEQGVVEGWDDSWGDSWDDEEAPKTPSLPVTPSLSSKGIASRKVNKDAWKD